MKVEITQTKEVELTLEVECDNCGVELTAEYTDGTLYVEPCNCLAI